MIASVAAWVGRSALMQSPVGGLLKRVPGWAWYALALIGALAVLATLHTHAVHKAIAAAEARGEARAYARVEAKARAIEAKVNATTGKISAAIRSKHDEETRANARDADALRLHGPGRASLPACAGLPATAGRYVPAGPGADAAGTALPVDNGLAVVPWGWLVDRGEGHDALRSEVLSWRQWYAQQAAAWTRLTANRETAAKP